MLSLCFKARVDHLLACIFACVILRCTSGATPAYLLTDSMAASRALHMHVAGIIMPGFNREDSISSRLMAFLPTAYVVRDGRLYFHFVCQSHVGDTWPGPAGGYPIPGWGVPWPGPDGRYSGIPSVKNGVPLWTWTGVYCTQIQMGGTPGYPLVGVTPHQGVPPRYRRTDGELDTPRSVCLLRSRRRTFLFDILLCVTNGWCSFSLLQHPS